jgi:trypsin
MKILSKLILLSSIALSSSTLLRRRETDETHGRMLKKRIIGGFQAPTGRYPYTVSLQNPDTGHFCGGSLIAKDVVLSAAHCAGVSYEVVIGRYDLDSGDGDVVQKEREVPHPKYNPSSTDNDFNLIFLTRKTTADVPIVKLNKEKSVPSATDAVEVMGWGDTDASEWSQRLSDVLRSVEVNVVTNEECSQAKGYVGWFNYESYEGSITSNMLCAQDTNQDSCQGDSGGPLIIKGNDSGGADDVQVGIVSWGIGCAESGFPGVYSRISSAYEWIRSEVCLKSSEPPSSFECDSIVQSEMPPAPAPLPAVTIPITTIRPPSSSPIDPNASDPSSDISNEEEPSSGFPSLSNIWCYFFGCR